MGHGVLKQADPPPFGSKYRDGNKGSQKGTSNLGSILRSTRDMSLPLIKMTMAAISDLGLNVDQDSHTGPGTANSVWFSCGIPGYHVWVGLFDGTLSVLV